MADRVRWRRLFKSFLPANLTTGDGELVHYSLGATVDLWFERLREGIRARFPSHAPDDALSLIGKDRKIVRGINEPRESYKSRLVRAPDDHRVRGNPWALMGQLRGYMQEEGVTRTVDANGTWCSIAADGSRSYLLSQTNWNWMGELATIGDPDLWGGKIGTDETVICAAMWSRFWPLLFPIAIWTAGPTIGDPDLWGGAIGTDGYTIGSTATPDEVANVRAIVRAWKPDGTRCMRIIVAFGSGDFEPSDAAPPNPDGFWNDPDNRLPNAAYWRA